MRSPSHSNINVINAFDSMTDGSISANKMRDIIIASLEASKRSGVPVLFFSNPGFGKTTTIYNYAKHNGYHVEVLCGSQYAQDEILGFQTNEGGASLVIKEPEWYSRIMENKKAGKPSILFLDELSTVCGPTQGALLQLCFERRIRGGKALPEDCLVVAAANYKQNLPGYSEIIAPALNRFCIVNLLPENANDVVMEFMQGLGETDDEWPEYKNEKISEADTITTVSDMKQFFIQLFQSYTAASSKGHLNIRNTEFDGIYDRADSNPEVLNFISGRTMSYLTKMVLALASMGIKSSSPVVKKIINGLIGLGTNTWGDDIDEVDKRLESYNRDIFARLSKIIDKLYLKVIPEDDKPESKLSKLQGNDSLSSRIAAFQANPDSEKYSSDELADLTGAIMDKYDCDKFPEKVEAIFKSKSSVLAFRSDMDALELLLENMEGDALSIPNLKPYIGQFTRIWKTYKFYSSAASVSIG